MLVRLVPLVAMLQLCLCDFRPYPFLTKAAIDEDDLIEAIDKILNFFYYDMNNVNVDGLTGIIVAEAQLNMILHKINIKSTIYGKLVNLQAKCHNLNKLLKNSIDITSKIYEKIYNKVLDTSLWEVNSSYSNHSLKYFHPDNWAYKSCHDLSRMMYRGPPNEEQSDVCIEELIDSVKETPVEVHDCVPSSGCHNIMSQLDTAHGYPLTHKLLYVQLSRALQCRLEKNVVQKSIKKLCSRILQEHRSIESLPHIYKIFQDLYLEQMVLCGIEGFTEFLTRRARRNLLAWQSAYGCYGQDVPPLEHRWRAKREVSRMKYGCESHITGLAAAAIAVHLNYMLSSASSLSESDGVQNFNILLLI